MKLSIAAMVALLMSASGAQAAVMVVGDGPERACYLSAKSGTTVAEALNACNDALTNRDLILHDRAATYVNRGVIRINLKRIDEALSDINTAIRILPDLGDAYVNRGVAYIARKDFTTALDDINKGLSLNPSDPAVAYFDRAVAEEEMGQLADAYHDYQKSAAIDPHFMPAVEALTRFKVILKKAS